MTGRTGPLRAVPALLVGGIRCCRGRRGACRQLSAGRGGCGRRRQLMNFMTATSILLAGTMSWAFATGRAAAMCYAIVDPPPPLVPVQQAVPECRTWAGAAVQPPPQQPQRSRRRSPAAHTAGAAVAGLAVGDRSALPHGARAAPPRHRSRGSDRRVGHVPRRRAASSPRRATTARSC
jgi:hypothetical protein